MKKLLYLLTGLCLLAGVFTGCEKEEKPFVPKEPDLQEDYIETAFGMNLEMVYVKGGSFKMGATAEQGNDVEDREKPVRTIKLDSYHIGKYEVTQAQWQAVMGQNSNVSDVYGKGDDYPVYYVSWNDAQEFCKRLSETTDKKYVLPTEAQWEYAARGGVHKTKTKFAGSNDVDKVAWYKDNSNNKTHPVGMKAANALGIYDMSGNVWEWCSDWYSEAEYDKDDDYNPQGPATGSDCVFRGGSRINDAGLCRVSYRLNRAPDRDGNGLGFRVACRE